VAAARLNGYRTALAAAGVAAKTAPVVECALNDERQARDLTTPLLQRGAADRPSAILAMSDRLALGAVAAAREAGLAVPDDLSVTGFDDVAGGTLTELPLTTIRQPHAEKGRTAVRMLTAPVLAAARVLATELVVRASSGRRPDFG